MKGTKDMVKYLCGLVICVLFLMGTTVSADPIDLGIEKLNLPELNEGLVYSAKNQKVENALTLTLLEKQTKIGKFALDVGYVIENEPIVAIMYELGSLKQFGVDLPLMEYLDIAIGPYAGYEFNVYKSNDDDNEWEDALDYGVTCRIISVKF